MLQPGNSLQIWVNQGWRQGYVLARINDKALVEYEMPNGSTALRIVPHDAECPIELPPWEYRNISYRRVNQKWLKEIVERGIEWIGCPQQTDEAPSVYDLYKGTFSAPRTPGNAK